MNTVSTDSAGCLQADQIDGLIAAAGVDGARDILDAFERSTIDLLQSLSGQVAEKDFGAASATAHAIKGSAANVGASRLAQSAAQLETACKEGASDSVQSLAAALQKDFEDARRSFEEHLANA